MRLRRRVHTAKTAQAESPASAADAGLTTAGFTEISATRLPCSTGAGGDRARADGELRTLRQIEYTGKDGEPHLRHAFAREQTETPLSSALISPSRDAARYGAAHQQLIGMVIGKTVTSPPFRHSPRRKAQTYVETSR